MEWSAFRDAHYRPGAVVLFLAMGVEPEDGERACERLAEALRPAGDYAVKREGGSSVRIAFELERDARRFGRAAGAHRIRREPEWALTLVGRLDLAGRAPKRSTSRGRGIAFDE